MYMVSADKTSIFTTASHVSQAASTSTGASEDPFDMCKSFICASTVPGYVSYPVSTAAARLKLTAPVMV